MAERRNTKVKMSLSSVSSYLVLIVLLEVAVKSQMSSNSNSHVFLQANNEVRYIVDNIPVSMHKGEFSSSPGVRVQNVEDSTMYGSKAHLKFEPSLLDFKERHLGVPHHEKVTILNLNSNKTVHMSSISGNTVHFHSSFFQDKVIPPLGNTSFNVVFLGREEGEIESSLFIHTSEGSFKYQVKGASIQSPYRLRPLSGVRLPLNASYSPLILMHNPHSTPLQLVEVYSSGGEFHLELPSGELEGPKHLWEIPAFLTKPIIRVRFHARAQKNHTAYIRLKVNNSEEVLVVPLEVEVGSSCGLYSPDDVIDFGIGGSHDPPKKLKLWVRNSWKKPIRIQNVISMPVSKALKIDFQPEKVPPDVSIPTQIAELTFDWKAALETGHTSGRIVVKSKQSGHKLIIPYTATVLEGGLSFDYKATRFRSDSGQIPPRPFQITNNYKVPVAITNVSLSKDASKHFEVCKFKPQILQPGQSTILLEIAVSQGATIYPDLKLESVMLIYTNISTLSVPLLCYNGKLVKVIQSQRNETDLELGTVGSETSKVVHFALVNENPVSVNLYTWDTSLHSAVVSLVAIQPGNVSTFLAKSYFNDSITEEKSIGPGQYGVFRLMVKAGAEIGEAWGKVWVRTEFEYIEISAHMRIEHGSLQVTPDPIVFDDCFPGKLCTQSMKVQSLFSVAMAVTGISSVPTDPRLSFTPDTPPLLTPAATSHLGHLTWDAQLLMASDNYLGVSQNTSAGSTRWLDTLILPAHTFDYDLSLLAARYDHYLNLSSHLLNLSLRLDTTEVRDHAFNARVRLSWPSLVTPSENIVFPLTQVGNTSHRMVTVTNPGTRDPLLVQVMLENLYPMAGSIVDRLPERLRPPCNQCSSHSNPNDFIVDTLSRSKYSGIQLPGVHIHRDASTFVLHPSANVTIRLGFVPSSAQFSSALLLIRNNLTVLETVRLSGTGAYAQFKFGNRKPGSSAALMFELAEKHLKDCEKEKQRKFPAPNLTVKRSFTARNTGALPITVQGFYISGLPCEGYGFRVLNCDPFYLGPNSTRKVDIAFTPDFTLARVQRTLSVWTSEGGEGGSAANYTLVATLPPYLLATCSSVLARPTWEPLLYYSAVTFMVFLLVCVLAAAFLESDRALKCALLAMSRDNATVQPVLDLRLVGSSVVLGSSSSLTTSAPLLPASKGGTEPVASPSGSPLPGPMCNSADQEIAKERTKVEGELLAGVFTSSGMKCNKKKTDKEKTTVSKRNSDPTDSSTDCSQRRGSWANVFNRPLGLGSQTVKQHTKTLTASSSSTPTIVDSSNSQLSTKQASSREPLKCEQAVRSETLQRLTPPTLIQKSTDNKEKRRSTGSKKNLSNSCSHKRIEDGSSGPSSGGLTEDVETSSTTTESSSTHDDGDKEVEVTMANQESDHVNSTVCHRSQQSRVSKTNSDPTSNLLKKITPTEQSGGSASSLEADWDEDDTVERETNHIINKKLQGRNSRKQTNKVGKLDAGHLGNGGKSKMLKNANNKQQNRNKDKVPVIRKRPNYKVSTKGLGNVFDVSTPPPPPAVNAWGESRATFSDVVARSDSYSSVVAPRHNSDSNLSSYTANSNVSQPQHSNVTSASLISSASASLGPIGPKKQLSSVWGNWGENSDNFHTSISPPATTSSLFMDSYSESSTATVQNNGFESVWSEPNLVLKMLQAEEQRRLEAEEFQRCSAFQDAWTGVNSLWDPLYTPASSNLTSTGTLENTNSPLMWGNDVWAPTPPPTAPWAPPGLTPHPPPGIRINSSVLDENSELAGEIDHGLEYDPFRSLSTIWSPHTPSNIWNPPTTK